MIRNLFTEENEENKEPKVSDGDRAVATVYRFKT